MPEEWDDLLGPAFEGDAGRDARATLAELETRAFRGLEKDTPLAAVARIETGAYLRGQLLRDIDAVSMAHGLEVRVPFVDHRLASKRLAGARPSRRSDRGKTFAAREPAAAAAGRNRRTSEAWIHAALRCLDARRSSRDGAARYRVFCGARLGERPRGVRGVGRLGARTRSLVARLESVPARTVPAGGCVSVSSSLPVTHIRPGARAVSFTLNEVWQARELLYFLVWRDVKVRYKQTVLGIGWSVLQPFLAMVVFTIFFGRLAKMPSDGVPYPLFSLAALVPWTYFAAAAVNGSTSLVGNQHLLAKVYFPRVLVPLAAVLMPAVDLAVSFTMLLVLMAWYHVMPTAARPAAAAVRGARHSRPPSPSRSGPRGSAFAIATLATSCRSSSRSGSSLTPVAYPGLAGSRTLASALRAQPDGDRRRRLPERAAGNAGPGRWPSSRWSSSPPRLRRRAYRVLPVRRRIRFVDPRLMGSDVADSHHAGSGSATHRRARGTARHAARSHRRGGDAPVPPPCARAVSPHRRRSGRSRTSRTRFAAAKSSASSAATARANRTLLKILSRITTPTEGEADIHGRVGSLLEVGTGFHPDLTGRENIFLNGAILGMRKAEIDAQVRRDRRASPRSSSSSTRR